eukprot:2701100-Prymnesium_polylepis.1
MKALKLEFVPGMDKAECADAIVVGGHRGGLVAREWEAAYVGQGIVGGWWLVTSGRRTLSLAAAPRVNWPSLTRDDETRCAKVRLRCAVLGRCGCGACVRGDWGLGG